MPRFSLILVVTFVAVKESYDRIFRLNVGRNHALVFERFEEITQRTVANLQNGSKVFQKDGLLSFFEGNLLATLAQSHNSILEFLEELEL